ncbi:hypothetical protein ACXXDK_04170 [Deinococcus sp. PESE-38]
MGLDETEKLIIEELLWRFRVGLLLYRRTYLRCCFTVCSGKVKLGQERLDVAEELDGSQDLVDGVFVEWVFSSHEHRIPRVRRDSGNSDACFLIAFLPPVVSCSATENNVKISGPRQNFLVPVLERRWKYQFFVVDPGTMW